jgi:osmotically-inducible protein OsmY
VLIATLLLPGVVAMPGYAATGTDDIRHSDIWLKASLLTTYTLNEHLNPLDIDVEIEDGVATLKGTVDSAVERDLAAELARGTEGIQQVRNELEVRPGETGKSGDGYGFRDRVADANTTARVKSRMLWNAETQGLQINVDTRDGVVSLEGRVASEAEAELATQIARNTSGVREVRTRLEVDPEDRNLQQQAKQAARALGDNVNDAWITTKVKTSLLYTKGVDGTAIHVETSDRIVRLSGTLDSQRAIDRAIRTANNTVGVKDVRSELTLAGKEEPDQTD